LFFSFFFVSSLFISLHHGSSGYSHIYTKFGAPRMKSKKGGNKKGKKGGGGKKPPQQTPKADEEAGVVLPDKERNVVPGFGCMVTKPWARAYDYRLLPQMIESARTNMQRYGDKVTDAQSKASLLHMLGFTLRQSGEIETRLKGIRYESEALELIMMSLDTRSKEDILFGVWPEDCILGLKYLSPQIQLQGMNNVQKWIHLTRTTINSEMERMSNDRGYVLLLQRLSQGHYDTELRSIGDLSPVFALLGDDGAEEFLSRSVKRVEEIETLLKREGWTLAQAWETKANLLIERSERYERHGKQDLALDILSKGLEEGSFPIILNMKYSELSLKMGRIEDALKSMEKPFSDFRSIGGKPVAVEQFRNLLGFVPEESLSLFKELLPQYPHVLWAASSADFVELSDEQNKALRSQLERKEAYCFKCKKWLTKVYRCSRCDIATYCGSACQKEAWKEHKKICKKRE
jgi:hypothetical protein